MLLLLSTFIVYPKAIRRLHYTADAIEASLEQFRNVTKSEIYPNFVDEEFSAVS